MLAFIWRQLRGRAGRSVALLAGVLVATTGFVVLTGATTTSRLEVTGAVERDTRAAYDILVRPKGTRTPLEAERGLVRPNYLSGLFGGITTAQYEQVRAVTGVDVAAPIAMLGYSTTPVPVRFDATDAIDRSLERQVIRVDPTFVAERELSTATGKPRYVYVTKRPVIYPRLDVIPDPDQPLEYSDGRSYPWSGICGFVPREVLPDGRTAPVCDPEFGELTNHNVSFNERDRWQVDTVRLLPDGRFEARSGVLADGEGFTTSADRLVLTHQVIVPFLLAAIDPAAEERLVGLTGAVVQGRALRPDDTITEITRGTALNRTLPVLTTSRPFLDGALRTTMTRLPGLRAAGIPAEDLEQTLRQATGVRVGSSRSELTDGFEAQLAEGISETGCCFGQVQSVLQAGAVEYDRRPDGALQARALPPIDPKVYGDEMDFNPLPLPWLSGDTPSRSLRVLSLAKGGALTPFRFWRAVGAFDPQKLAGFSDLGKVPLETYEPPMAEGADDRSRTALGGQPLEPSGNPAGYLSAPPLLLTNLASVPKLLKGGTSPQLSAPISAIRVRVADVHGYSKR
ncbi:ABC transporter permease, partial [Micromonospora sp. SL4-19]